MLAASQHCQGDEKWMKTRWGERKPQVPVLRDRAVLWAESNEVGGVVAEI